MSAALGVVLLAAGLPCPSASAAYEEVGAFAGILEAPAEAGKFPEEMQLGNTGGIAVNYTGAGGVPKGTLYATSEVSAGDLEIARYEPSGESMSFVEAWEVRRSEGPYKHCGPLLVTPCAPRPGGGHGDVDVDVDQSTGNVYVLQSPITAAGTSLIAEYSPDGSEVIARFGEKAEEKKTTAETPSQIHSTQAGGIATNGTGEVYVFDSNVTDKFYHRLMVFKPQTPGDYEHYAYAGEIAAGFFGEGNAPQRPVTDATGHVYVDGNSASGEFIEELAPEAPSSYPAPHQTPLCSFTYPKFEGITSVTVNPTSGEPFFFSIKKEAGLSGKNVKMIHQLGPCSEATHKFEAGGKQETGKFEVKPERGELYAMAYDPGRKLPASSAAVRPAGALYGAAPSGEPDLGTGGEPALGSLGYVFAPTTGAAKFKLTATKSGTGQGSVTSYPAGVFCGSAFCVAEFEEGKEVELKAAAATGSKLVKWGGACSGSGSCKVMMNAAKEVTAEFALKLKFKLSVTKTGNGVVTSVAPNTGINCGPTCSAEFEEDSVVELTSSADGGFEFVEWGGACSGSGSCKVTMSEAKSVTATFEEEGGGPASHTLTLHVSGNGSVSADSGTITACTSAGGPSCEGTYEEDTEVTLTETPEAGNEFIGWGTPQCDESTAETCKVSIGSSDEDVSASFQAEPLPGIPLKVSLEGAGTVSADKGLISCNPFCEDEYPEGTVVTLSASPAASSLFMAWRHCDSVNGRQCTVTMSKAKEVSAVFYAAHALTVSKAPGSGPGKLQSYGGLTCLYACTSTTSEVREGTAVTVKATPAKHFHLLEWGGDCTGTGACELSMGEDHEVGAFFAQDPKLSLSLSKSGGGQALIKTRPAGIVCSYACTAAGASLYEGEAVELRWKLGKGTKRLTWSEGAGTCVGSTEALEGSCTLSLDSATALVAALE